MLVINNVAKESIIKKAHIPPYPAGQDRLRKQGQKVPATGCQFLALGQTP